MLVLDERQGQRDGPRVIDPTAELFRYADPEQTTAPADSTEEPDGVTPAATASRIVITSSGSRRGTSTTA